jgi:hypothetical protein
MNARYFGNDEVNSVNSGPSSASFNQIGQAESEQQFGDVAVAVHRAQAEALDHRAQRPHQQRRHDERRPEAQMAADDVGEIRAQHVEAGMRKVENAHHAEDQRQA